MKLNIQNNFNKLCNYLINGFHDQDSKINRITCAVLPYFNFYGPFNAVYAPLGQCLLIAENGQKGYADLTYAIKSHQAHKQFEYWRGARAILEIATTVSAIAYYRLGMILSTFTDLANQTHEIAQIIRQGQWTKKEISDPIFKFSVTVVRLGSLICAAPEILVASIVLQIFLEMGQSYKEYQKGRYLEMISNLGLALIRSYQVAPQIHQLFKKSNPDPAPMKSLVVSKPLDLPEGVERRATIDVGSGGTKVLIADVNVNTQEIVNVIFENSFSVPYQASLEKSADGHFDAEVKEQGLQVFHQIKTLLNNHQVQKVSAVATEAFRKSTNGCSFANSIHHETGIPLHIISQEQEGILAFNSAIAVSKVNVEKAIVWDIGTGSFQMTTKKENEFNIFTKGLGSVPFKNHIIDQIQGKDPSAITTPNPLSQEDYKKAGCFARWLAKKADPNLKAKIKMSDVEIIGIGRLFLKSVLPHVSQDSTITRKELRNFIRSSLGKMDQDLNNPFAHVDVPNCIQVLETMKALHIHKISVVNTTATQGMMIGSEQDFANWMAS